MATKQQPKYKVLDTWRDAVFQKHGFYPQLNRNVEQWAARDLVDSYTLPVVLELIDYDVMIAEDTPKWETFRYKADLLLDRKRMEEEDAIIRAENRRKAKLWLQD
tara:strand:- start:1474 stop:1788 length:315 start_codon:yes stop_codon:yes gene_type:complete